MKYISLTVNPCIDLSYYPKNTFLSGSLNRVSSPVKTPGGKGINITRALVALGELDKNNVSLYFAPHPENDELSALFSRLCTEIEFASFSPIPYTDPEKRMRTCIKIFSPDGPTTEINEEGSSIGEDDMIRLIGALADLISSGEPTVLMLCGSIPQDVEFPVYNSVIKLMKSCGVTCVLDSSGKALADGLDACPDLIKPNLEELSALAGRSLEYGDEAVEYCKYVFHRYGCEVLLTNGGKGSYFIGREGVIRCTPSGNSHSLSTGSVGCGDLFLAAFAQSYFGSSSSALDSLARATAYATHNALNNTQRGVSFCLPDKPYDDLMKSINIQRLE